MGHTLGDLGEHAGHVGLRRCEMVNQFRRPHRTSRFALVLAKRRSPRHRKKPPHRSRRRDHVDVGELADLLEDPHNNSTGYATNNNATASSKLRPRRLDDHTYSALEKRVTRRGGVAARPRSTGGGRSNSRASRKHLQPATRRSTSAPIRPRFIRPIAGHKVRRYGGTLVRGRRRRQPALSGGAVGGRGTSDGGLPVVLNNSVCRWHPIFSPGDKGNGTADVRPVGLTAPPSRWRKKPSFVVKTHSPRRSQTNMPGTGFLDYGHRKHDPRRQPNHVHGNHHESTRRKVSQWWRQGFGPARERSTSARRGVQFNSPAGDWQCREHDYRTMPAPCGARPELYQLADHVLQPDS